MLTEEQIQEKFGLTSARLDEMEKEAANGILPGKPNGGVIAARTLAFGEESEPSHNSNHRSANEPAQHLC